MKTKAPVSMKRFSGSVQAWLYRLFFLVAASAMLVGRGTSATVDDFVPLRYTNTPTQILPARFWAPKFTQPDQKYPLVIFLHGAGERGTDNRLQLEAQTSPMVFVEPQNQARWPCFMLAPQCPPGLTWAGLNAGDNWGDPDGTGDFTTQPTWPLASVMALLAQLTNSGPSAAQIDVSRVFITGLSMGGFGTWEAISRWPTLFRAAVPICGGGDPRNASKIGATPVWAFHAEDDGVVMVERSRQMVLALRALGQRVRYTEFPASLGIGHGSWIPAYGDFGLLPWMFGESRVLGGDGLYVEYFATTNLSGNVRTRRIEPSPDLFWGTAAPTGVTSDRFSARFSGQVVLPVDGRYTWRASADDRLSVWIDGEPLIVPETPMTNGIAVTRELTVGRHDLRLEFAEITGRAWLRLEVGLEGQPLQPLLTDSLFSGVTRVEAPTFDPPAGEYSGVQTIRVSCATPDAILRYTTNGMIPTAQSPRYTGPLVVAYPGLLRAAATKVGLTNSLVVSADYQITPAILSPPTNRVVAPGGSVVLKVVAVGKGPLRYQWQRAGVPLANETRDTLTLTNVQVGQTGLYAVQVSDDSSTVTSTAASLFVGLKPSFLVRPQNVNVLLGDPASFSAEVSGTPPFQFLWRRNGQPLTNFLLSSALSILPLPAVDNTHVASYSVTVTNPAGSSLASSTVRLSLQSDTDNDRLPDAWETLYGFSPSQPADAEVDSDGDGHSDRAEYLAGTNPRATGEVLSLGVGRVVGDQLELTARLMSNRTYRVLRSVAVAGADWSGVLDLSASLTNRSVTLAVPLSVDSRSSYYRLVTPAIP